MLCKDEEIGISDSVEQMVLDIRNPTKKLGKRERKKWAQRIGIIKKTEEFMKAYRRTGTNDVLRVGVVPGRVWGSNALGMAPSQRETLAKTVGRCGRKEAVNLALFVLQSKQL